MRNRSTWLSRSPEKRRAVPARWAAPLLAALVFTSIPTGAKTIQPVQGKVPSHAALDVYVQVFDPGLGERGPAELEERGIFTDLRRAEARFIAFRLRNTLESTGNWGAVRMVPAGAGLGDLVVEGRILKSNGAELAVMVRATDATGRVWFDKKFKQQADRRVYEDPDRSGVDPFQNLYNQIANRLLTARLRQKDKHVATVREISRLRFATLLAPETFAPYLAQNRKGFYSILRLPSVDDPMMARIEGIKHSDDLFVDVLDQHYAGFRMKMAETYDRWRADSYETQRAVRETRRRSRWSKILGGFLAASSLALEIRSEQKEREEHEDSDAGAVESALAEAAALGAQVAISHGLSLDQEKNLYRLDLRELAASMDAEVEPVLLEVEGKTLRLTGSKEQQFAEWRGTLQRIWTHETGLGLEPQAEPVWLVAAE